MFTGILFQKVVLPSIFVGIYKNLKINQIVIKYIINKIKYN